MFLDLYRSISAEEKANVWSHLIGLIILIGLMPFLFSLTGNLSTMTIVGFVIFAVMVTFSYGSSVRYHLAHEVADKKNWRRVDHICIYLLIGGSYTAFILRFVDTSEGFMFLGLHWLIIVLGILKKIWFTGRYEFISVASYLFLGWMVVFIYNDITASMSEASYRYLWMGGASYTIGVLFYVWNSLKFNHFIWHLFVFGGTLCHFISLFLSI